MTPTPLIGFRPAAMAIMAMLALACLATPNRLAAAPSERVMEHSTVRLVDAGTVRGARAAGVVVAMKEGWKTYWRNPGEAGLPPRFDWAASGNLAAAKVLWPAPRRYPDPEAGETIGYKKQVVFPVLVTPADPARPVELNLKLSYGICRKICVPVNVDLSQSLPPLAAGSSRLVADYAARAPASKLAGLAIVGVRIEGKPGSYRLTVSVQGAHAGTVEDIFVEGSDEAYFAAAGRAGKSPAGVNYAIPALGLDGPEALRGKTLKLTIISSAGALASDAVVE